MKNSAIISVAKQISYFIILLLIIVMGFAHAFYILLKPKINYSLDIYAKDDDPNNPWNMVSSYNQLHDDSVDPNFMIELPDKNTKVFSNYGTALFTSYKHITSHIRYQNKRYHQSED